MVRAGSIVEDLRSIVGDEYAFDPGQERKYWVDGLFPKVAVAPGSYEEVAAVLRYANERRLAVIPQGGRWFTYGNVPRAYDIALSTKRLDAIIEYEPADMTVTCQAGISGGRLNVHLQRHGQMVPFQHALPEDDSTLGGLLAVDRTWMRLPNARPRDFTIGLRVVTADGRLSSAGGRVVKNVAGYDLCKLHIGAMGTLGVIVEATFKTFPLPQARDRRLLGFDSIQAACDFVFEAERRGACLARATIHREQRSDGERYVPVSGYILSVALGGSTAAVVRSCADIDAMAARIRVRTFDPASLPKIEGKQQPAGGGDPLMVDAMVRRTDIPALVDATAAEPPGPFFGSIDPAIGEVSATWLAASDHEGLLRRLRAIVQRLGGNLLVKWCDEELKKHIDVFGPPPPSFPLMKAIKQQFDPNGILSPGRFVGRL